MTISEQLAYATVRIECETISGDLTCDTGYFFRFNVKQDTKEHIPVVITNKHVICDAQKGKLIFTICRDNNPIDKEHFEFFIDNFESYWKKHPDADVDLCAMPIAPFIRAAEGQRGKERFFFIYHLMLV